MNHMQATLNPLTPNPSPPEYRGRGEQDELIAHRGGSKLMCELMGMSFAKPVVASVSIQAFSERSKDNADGWGLAWYPDRSLAMIKQPVRWSIEHTQFLEHYPGLLSSTYVAHVRQKTTGHTPTHADTHPFSRELNGREYCFAHNGTLTGEKGCVSAWVGVWP